MSAEPGSNEQAGESTRLPLIQVFSAVLWPSFLVAGIATVVIFTIFDPLEMISTVAPVAESRLGGYSAGFLTLWLICALSSAATVYFCKPCERLPVIDPDVDDTSA